MEELLKQILEGQVRLEQSQVALVQGQAKLAQGQAELKQSLTKIEQEIGGKISALFDAREIQIDSTQHINDRLSRMESTINKMSLKMH